MMGGPVLVRQDFLRPRILTDGGVIHKFFVKNRQTKGAKFLVSIQMSQFSHDFYSISIAKITFYLYYHPGGVKHEIEVNNWLAKH